MNNTTTPSGIAAWGTIRAFLDDMVERNLQSIATAATAIVSSLRAGGLVYTAGSGHSLGSVNETFFRAGGLTHVRPIWQPDLFPLNGAIRSSAAERTEGLGVELTKSAGIGGNDTLVVFSNSGVNPVPIDIADSARSAGATVIAIMSTAAQAGAPLRASQLLQDVSTILIDTGVPAGDASWPPGAPRTAPLSTLANVTAWDLILATVCDEDAGASFWRSANQIGNDESNHDIAQRLSTAIPELTHGT